jgi:hypothetical protein
MAVDTKVTVDLSNVFGVAETLAAALANKSRPAEWRPSEYAMTKAKAIRVADELREQRSRAPQVTLGLFDWHILQGELARLVKAKSDETARELFMVIHTAILANPDAARRQERWEEFERAQKQAREARETIERLERVFRQEQLDAETAVRLAALPCGGCRKRTCGYCCWELGLEPSEN